MKFLKKFDYQEHKSKILFLTSFTIGIFIIYTLVISPFKNYTNKKDRVNSFEIKNKKEEKLNQANNQRYNKLVEELKEVEKYYTTLEEKAKEKSFKNISSFESFISEKSDSHYLTIETIGRIERISETDKIYIPYIITGEITDIFSFIKEIENSDKKISFTDTLTQISFSPQGKIITKISANVLNTKLEKTEEHNPIPISELRSIKISKIKYLNFNNKIYIIINYKDGSKNIFHEGEEIIFNNLKYRIILKNGSPFLQLIKN